MCTHTCFALTRNPFQEQTFHCLFAFDIPSIWFWQPTLVASLQNSLPEFTLVMQVWLQCDCRFPPHPTTCCLHRFFSKHLGFSEILNAGNTPKITQPHNVPTSGGQIKQLGFIKIFLEHPQPQKMTYVSANTPFRQWAPELIYLISSHSSRPMSFKEISLFLS